MLERLEPQMVWKNFSALNAIPRASKKEEQIAAWVRQFGQNLGLEVLSDETGNVVIKKPGQGKGANAPAVIMQAHLDMVHQKNADTVFDFDTQGIDMYIDGDWVKARGTTLGADNGMGAAYILTVLEDNSLDHPPIEALFTLDEEAGMTGAKTLGPGLLEGKILLNLDTEDEREITIGCAGGIDTNVTMDLKMEDCPSNSKAYYLTVKGLQGGHSGMDIHLGRGNANKILFRLLYQGYSKFQMRIASIDGGGLRNAIPREAFASLVVDITKAGEFEQHILHLGNEIKKELRTTDPHLDIHLETAAIPAEVLDVTTQVKIIRAIYSLPNGVFRMSADIPGLVETSSNLARVLIKNGQLLSQSLQRSSVESAKMDIANAVRAAFEQIGASVENAGDYPGWKPEPDSNLLRHAIAVYKEVFQREPDVNACHAGLECGIINGRYPGLDMISVGPDIRGAHSPDERVRIESVANFWTYLKALLNSLS